MMYRCCVLLLVCFGFGACGDSAAKPEGSTEAEGQGLAPAGATPGPAPGAEAGPRQGSTAAQPGESIEAAPKSPTAGTGGQATGQRPTAPARVFDSSRAPQGAWFDALAKRFSAGPDGDDWPTEVIGPFVQGRLNQLLLGLGREQEGEQGLAAEELAKRWEGGTQLVPAELTSLRDRDSLRVRHGNAFPALEAPVDAASINSALRQLLKPVAGPAMGVMVQVVACTQTERTRFETIALIRLDDGGSAATGASQINLRLRSVWRINRRVLLASIEALEYELVEVRQGPFAERTRQVLPVERYSDRDLWNGGIEYSGRHDRAIPSTNIYLGMHGLGVGDLDGDGLEDVYVARQGGLPNLLWSHQADGTVRSAAAAAGVDFLEDTGGVLICDLDGDGARDLALGLGATLVVCWNDGSGGFHERTQLALKGGSQVYSITAADADGDGDLDLYDTRYFAGNRAGGAPTPYHDARNGAANAFWRQTEARSFVDATAALGLDQNNDRFSLAALWEDLDSDGDLDLYVTNDFGRNNLYLNEGGSFRDVAEERGALDMAAGMGISVADVELDGDLDLYVSNMHSPAGERVIAHPRFQAKSPIEVRAAYQDHARGNSLLLARGDGTFQRLRPQGVAGTGPGGWAWGSVFCDFDGDGLADIVVPNGFATGRLAPDLASFFWRVVVNASPTGARPSDDYLAGWQAISHLSQVEGLSWNGHERHYAYWNLGDGRFVDASAVAGLDYEEDGRVVSPCDWDLDGRLDLWLKNRTAPGLRFLHGQLPEEPRWIAVELQAQSPNTEAIGALVRVELESGRILRARVHAGYGYLGSPSKRLRFGLGEAGQVQALHVQWPGGDEVSYGALPHGRLYRLTPAGEAAPVSAPAALDAAQPGHVLEPRIGPEVVRVPALASLPLGPLRLPGPDGTTRTVADFAGKPLLVLLWGSWDDPSLASAKGLADSGLLDQAGAPLALWPVSLDKARHGDYARTALAATGLTELGGRADKRTRKLFELFAGEILGPFEDLPLPMGFLFDRAGQLVCLYAGTIDPEVLAADVLALGREEPCSNPVALTGGRWALRPTGRALEALAAVLERGSEATLAAHLRAAAKGR